jgi:hypothetical protein
MHKRCAVLLAVATIGILGACDRSPSRDAHVALIGVGQLRDAFNADSGKVRAIFLASPT